MPAVSLWTKKSVRGMVSTLMRASRTIREYIPLALSSDPLCFLDDLPSFFEAAPPLEEEPTSVLVYRAKFPNKEGDRRSRTENNQHEKDVDFNHHYLLVGDEVAPALLLAFFVLDDSSPS